MKNIKFSETENSKTVFTLLISLIFTVIYFWDHPNSISFQLIFPTLQVLKPLFIAGFWILIVCGAGLWINRFFLKIFTSRLGVVTGILCGSFGISLLVYCWMFFFRTSVSFQIIRYFIIIAGISGLIISSDMLKKFFQIKSSLKSLEYFFIILILIWFYYCCLVSLLPDTGFDSLIYHLPIAKSIGIQGQEFVQEVMKHEINRPISFSILFSLMVEKSAIVCKVFHMYFAFLTGLAIYLLARNFYSRIGSLTGALFFLSQPQIIKLSSMAYCDLYTSFTIAMGIGFLFSYVKNGQNNYLASAFFSLGCGMFSKYIAYSLYPAFFVAGIGILWIKKKTGKIYWVIWIPLLMVSVILLNNTLKHGDPIYPHGKSLAAKFFPEKVVESIEENPNFVLDQNKLLFLKSFGYNSGHGEYGIIDKMMVPIRISLFSHFHTPSYSLRYFDGMLNPLSLIILVLFFCFFDKKNEFHLMIFFLWALFFIFFVNHSHQVRFYLPQVILWSFVFFVVAENSYSIRKILTVFTLILFVFSIGVGMNRLNFPMKKSFLSGEYNENRFLELSLPFYKAFQWLNSNLSETQKVFLVGESRSFYLEKNFGYIGVEALSSAVRLFSGTDQKIKNYYKNRKITHLFFNKRYFEMLGNSIPVFFPETTREKLQNFILLNTTLVYQDERSFVVCLN